MSIGYFEQAQKLLDKDQYGSEVWMSSSKFAQNQQKVIAANFLLVLSCMETEFRFKNPYIQHLRLPIEQIDSDIKAYFQPSFQVIQAARKTGNVLIYSAKGISRSATIAVAYIMRKYNKKWDETLEMVKMKRLCAQPNEKYLQQLKWFQKFILNRF